MSLRQNDIVLENFEEYLDEIKKTSEDSRLIIQDIKEKLNQLEELNNQLYEKYI